jgi:glycosyltransferase involved in cell wall biosynthesis
VIAVSHEIQAKVVREESIPGDRITVIPNGVDDEIFDFVPDAPRPTRGEQRLIFTGNMAPYQGIDLMLEAFKAVRNEGHDVRLLIVTEEPFEPYEQLAADLGVRALIDVTCSTFDDVPAHLASADVALNPRVDCDGLPQKLLNYMAAGKPVVSFAGSAKHLVSGEHGLVVDNADTAAFARAVIRLLNDSDLSRRLGAKGREFVRSHLSWSSTARQVEAVYERLL